MHVLMIEDNEDDYRLFSAQVAKIDGSHIVGRSTLAEGLDYLKSEPVDVLVLDLSLPDAHGLPILDRIHESAPTLPVIILSGSSTDELALQAIQHGAQNYLVKGEFSGSMLARTLRMAHEHKRVKEQLRLSEQRFTMLVNSIEGYGLYTLDNDGYVTSWNKGAGRIKGYQPTEIIGKHFSCFYTPEDISNGLPEMVLETVRRTGHYNGEGWRVRKDGSHFWAEVAVTALRDTDDSIIGFSKVTRDLTERKHVEETLRRNEERYRLLASNLPDIAIMVYDTDYRYTLVEGSLISRIGYEREQIEGKTIDEAYQPEVTAVLKGHYVEALRGEVVNFELVSRNGLFFECQIVPIRDDKGTIMGGMVVVHDITKHKKNEAALTESEARFRRAVLHAPFPIMIHAEDGQVLNINHMWTELTGYTHEEIPTVGEWMERAHGERREIVKPIVDTIYSRERFYKGGEYKICTKSGEFRTWDFSAAPLGPLPDGRRIVISMAVDVTERNQLQQQNFDLALDHERLLMLSQFVRSTSHDLRTPLSMILTSAYMLRKLPPEKQLEKIEQIEAQVGDINKVLETSAYTVQLWSLDQLTCEPAKLDALLESVHNRVRSRLIARGHHLEFAAEPIVLAVEPTYLSQALFEILDNACSFTPENGKLAVRLFTVGDAVQIEIEDNGIGMTPEETEHVFEMFWRADPARKDYKEHHGLGLTITRRIIELHGGTIRVTSTPQVGTTFAISLPIPKL